MANKPAVLFLLLVVFNTPLMAAKPPELLQAEIWRSGLDISQYWVSEKLDGVRAYWDGQQLISRSGHVFAAPDWFVADFPARPLDGELWLGRGLFEQTVSIVRKQQPVDDQWQQLAYYLFELPDGAGSFSERIDTMKAIVAASRSPYLKLLTQFRVSDEATLLALLDTMVKDGAEGLMLHHQDSRYITGRSNALLKLKPWYDGEATVIAYSEGQGRNSGRLGALIVETADQRRFRLGSGFTDAQRDNPPPLGSIISYKYHGLTANGIPRFASFLRVRDEP